jgi:hypothetical protein
MAFPLSVYPCVEPPCLYGHTVYVYDKWGLIHASTILSSLLTKRDSDYAEQETANRPLFLSLRFGRGAARFLRGVELVVR